MAFPVEASAPKEDYQVKTLRGSYLKATSPISTRSPRLLKEDFEGLKYETLISCLAWYESSWRVDVYGDNGRAYSVLQFHEPTFDRFCEGDYKDPYDQINCADNLLAEDINHVYHWTTHKFCYTPEE